MFSRELHLERVRSPCPGDYSGPDAASCETVRPEEPTRAPTAWYTPAPTPDPVPCALLPGDVAIVSFNSDAPDSLTAVALAGVPAGSTLFFSDRPWTGADMSAGSAEGELTFAVSAAIPAGSTWHYPDGGAAYGAWTQSAGSFNLATAGDQILVYCGSSSTPFFLHGVSNNGWLKGTDTISSTTSFLPDTLNNSRAYATLPSLDNQYYDGPSAGTKAFLLDSVSRAGHWAASDPAPVDIGNFVVDGTTTAPTVSPNGGLNA
jgi:hypothetical protein